VFFIKGGSFGEGREFSPRVRVHSRDGRSEGGWRRREGELNSRAKLGLRGNPYLK